MKIYLITNYAELDGVLDLTKNKNYAFDLLKERSKKELETKLIKIEFDGRIFDYDWDDYKINFFEKIENNKGWATPYLDKTRLYNWGIYQTILEVKNSQRF